MKNWKKRGNFNNVTDVIFGNLGVKNFEDLCQWFFKDYKIPRLDEAADLVKSYFDRQIFVFGDYDVDGITSTAILVRALKAAGATNVRYRLPRRFSEGFGLNVSAIEEINAKRGECLIITVDNGIASLDAVTLAKSKGYSVIITDHHEPVVIDGDIVLPSADIIIDPHAVKGADFDGYCGAGIAFKLARCILNDDKKWNALLPLAAFGTICDNVPLREDNYVIAIRGINLSNRHTAIAGLNALKEVMTSGVDELGEYHFGFHLGPALNAPGRLYDDGAEKALSLLLTDDVKEAYRLAAELKEDNNRRKELAKEAEKMATEYIVSNHLEDDDFLVVYLPNVCEGIIGPLAGRLEENFMRPCIVFTDGNSSGASETLLKGSGRSTKQVNLKELLDEISPILVAYGGHSAAAGLTIRKNMLKDVRVALNDKVRPRSKCSESVKYYDLEVKPSDVAKTAARIDLYAPYGVGNPKPVFKVTDFYPDRRADGRHYQTISGGGAKMSCGTLSAVGFGLADIMPDESISKGSPLNLYGTISINYFRGSKTIQVEFEDVDDDVLPDENIIFSDYFFSIT